MLVGKFFKIAKKVRIYYLVVVQNTQEPKYLDTHPQIYYLVVTWFLLEPKNSDTQPLIFYCGSNFIFTKRRKKKDTTTRHAVQ